MMSIFRYQGQTTLIKYAAYLLVLVSFIKEIDAQDSEVFGLTVPQLISKYGYPVEEHFVITRDNYILRMHRIPHGKKSAPKNEAVLLMHGILCSSADWIISGPSQAFGYFLADAGYDVWLANARGNSQSRNHTTLNPDKDHSFWSFSWHEIGVLDLPALVDYVLSTTNLNQLYYIGHSQGANALYVMLSELPEYNAKIHSSYLLAPAVYVNHLISVPFRSLYLWALVEQSKNFFKIYEVLPNTKATSMAMRTFCEDGSITQPVCTSFFLTTFGYTPTEVHASFIPILVGHTPAGCSLKQLAHYGQIMTTGKFRQYDYGLDNLRVYKSFTPPYYDLSKIIAPVYVFYSNNDYLVTAVDAKRSCEELGSTCKGQYPDNHFNHLDYLYGIDAPEFLYKKVLSIMHRA